MLSSMCRSEGSVATIHVITSSNHTGFLGEIRTQQAIRTAAIAPGTSHSQREIGLVEENSVTGKVHFERPGLRRQACTCSLR